MLKPWDDAPVVAGLFGEVSGLQFSDDVARLTAHLQQHESRRWALCLRDSYHFAVAFLAAAHAGKELVLPGNLQPDALRAIADGYDAILDDVFFKTLETLSVRATFSPLDLNALRLTLYTSGSSGVPKAIPKRLAQLDAEVQTLEKLWGGQIADTLIAGTVSHQHIYGLLFRILWPLCADRPFERRFREHPEQIAEHGGAGITLISSPALLKRLELSAKPVVYRAVFSSGGALPFAAVSACRKQLLTIPIEVYGSTETGGIAFRRSQTAETPWELFPTLGMKLSDDECLSIRSPHSGTDGWLETADRCRMLSDRTFVLKGRADRVVKVEEKRISLPEIEQRLQAMEWIGEVVVFPFEQNGRQMLCSVITLTVEGQSKVEELGNGRFWILLRTELRRSIEPVGIPRRYRIVEQIPVNPQGKNDVLEMIKLFEEASHD
jgi:acyl-coenzyme A synthetase/AMP-(fatty) acid ligase